MGAQRGHDLGVDAGHAEVERVAVGELVRLDLNEGGGEGPDDRLGAVGRAGVHHDDLPRRHALKIEDGL